MFIESSLSLEELYNKKLEFSRAVQDKIGEQKIDVVIYCFGTPSLPIHQEARQTEIRLK